MAEGVQPPWDRLSEESPHKRRRGISLWVLPLQSAPLQFGGSLFSSERWMEAETRTQSSEEEHLPTVRREGKRYKAKRQGSWAEFTCHTTFLTSSFPTLCESATFMPHGMGYDRKNRKDKCSSSPMFTEKPEVANQMNLRAVALGIYQPCLRSNLWNTWPNCPPKPRKLRDMCRSLEAKLAYLLLRQQDRNCKLLSIFYPQYTLVAPAGWFQPCEHTLIGIPSA